MGAIADSPRAGLLLRGLRWRLGSTLVMLVVAVAAVASAALGPLYLRSADGSVIAGTLSAAQPDLIGLTMFPTSAGYISPARLAATVRLLPPGWYGPALYSTVAPVATVGPDRQTYSSALLARSGICGHLRFVRGSCPAGGEEVALSTRSAGELHLRLGSRVVASVQVDHATVPLKAGFLVTGLYAAPDPSSASSAYWWGNGDQYFGFGFGTVGVPSLDDMVTDFATMVALPARAPRFTEAESPLRPGRIHIGDVGSFKAQLRHFQSDVALAAGLRASSRILTQLAQASHEEHLMATVIEVVDAELVLLSLWVLHDLVNRSAEARRAEVRLAKLRGFGGRGLVRVAVSEPLVVIVAALPIGLAGAWVTVKLIGSHLLARGTPVAFDGFAVVAAAAAFVGAVIAVATGMRQLLTGRLGPQAEAGGGRRHRLASSSVAADTAALALAAAGVLALSTSGALSNGRTDAVAVVAPALIAVAVGVIGARLASLIARLLVAPTRDSLGVGSFLTVRYLARRPRLLRQVVVLSVAVGLVVFAVDGWQVAARNRRVQAAFTVGASQVLTVQVAPGVNLIEATDKADPTGRYAMAAVAVRTPSTDLIAVDTSRLARVASWPPGISRLSAASVSRLLDPAHAPTVLLGGDSLRLVVGDVRATGSPVELSALLFDRADETPVVLDLGRLRRGVDYYQASLGGACASVCRLVGLAAAGSSKSGSSPSPVAFNLQSVMEGRSGGGWTAIDADLATAAGWRGATGVRVGAAPPGGQGLVISFSAAAIAQEGGLVGPGSSALVGPADHPQHLPVAVTDQLAAADEPGGVPSFIPLQGLDGQTFFARDKAPAADLPRLGNRAALVDLGLVETAQTGPSLLSDQDEVWVASQPPRDLYQRLRRQGLQIVASDTASGHLAAANRGGLALADDFLVLAAAGGVALAATGLLFSVLAGSRQRGWEISSLEAAGVPRRLLRRCLVAEGLVVVCGAVLLGAVSAIFAARLALPSVPEFTSVPVGPPLDFSPSAPVLAGVLGLLLAVFGVVVVFTSMVIVSASSPGRLRGGGE
jgi:putative ABC transport system permease protein